PDHRLEGPGRRGLGGRVRVTSPNGRPDMVSRAATVDSGLVPGTRGRLRVLQAEGHRGTARSRPSAGAVGGGRGQGTGNVASDGLGQVPGVVAPTPGSGTDRGVGRSHPDGAAAECDGSGT